jgi:mannose-6-phosphate isomerase-like protein (cupin superfamily)
MEVDQKLLEKALREEGFLHTYVWQDGPYAFYSNHTHPVETAHIILDGEMTLTQGNETKTYCAGERCDVPAGAAHAAKMGLRGCKYLVGEK